MKATFLEYKDTGSFSNLLLNYLENDKSLRNFYNNRPSHDGFADQIQHRTSAFREELKSLLLAQYKDVKNNERSRANISLLTDDNTFTVTTGHQLNIFTGPLYFIFKIATTIKLSQELKKQFPDKNFIPVYWMASEDHDFAEINHTTLFGKTIQWNSSIQGGTGRISTTEMVETVKTYQNILGLSENSTQLSRLVEDAYLGHNNLADATRYLVHELFVDYGLVIIDADTPVLKKLFMPIIKKDILEQNSFLDIQSTSLALEKAGYNAQANVREINFFYLTDKFRERIIKTETGNFKILNQAISFTREELINEIETHPERFSPNALMRPLYQEVILPNLAYVGGAAEIAYWLQLKGMFNRYSIPFPILVPRNSGMIADNSLAEKIFRLNLTFKSIFKDPEDLKKEYVRLHTLHRLNLSDEWREFKGVFEKIKLRAHKIDPSLGPSTDAIKARLKKAVNNLEKKLLKAEKHNHEDALVQIDRIKNRLFPSDVLQERTENFGVYYLKYGDAFIDELIKHFDPLAFKFTIVY